MLLFLQRPSSKSWEGRWWDSFLSLRRRKFNFSIDATSRSFPLEIHYQNSNQQQLCVQCYQSGPSASHWEKALRKENKLCNTNPTLLQSLLCRVKRFHEKSEGFRFTSFSFYHFTQHKLNGQQLSTEPTRRMKKLVPCLTSCSEWKGVTLFLLSLLHGHTDQHFPSTPPRETQGKEDRGSERLKENNESVGW